MPMKCKYCGKEFKLQKRYNACNGYKGYFCSQPCYHKFRWKSTGKCKNCGKKTNQPIYCSVRCRKDYWNKNSFRVHKKPRNWERKKELIKRLGGKCIKCGISDIRVLDVNHKNPLKKERPKDRKYNWTRRFKEWDKNFNNLELLCSNCHRILTWKQRNFGLENPSIFKLHKDAFLTPQETCCEGRMAEIILDRIKK